MNILISSTILSLALILLADSIYRLRPHTKRKTRRRTGRNKKRQPMTRANVSVIDLHMTDLKANN